MPLGRDYIFLDDVEQGLAEGSQELFLVDLELHDEELVGRPVVNSSVCELPVIDLESNRYYVELLFGEQSGPLICDEVSPNCGGYFIC